MNDLFKKPSDAPLADRIRPSTLVEVVGQSHLIGDGKPLSQLLIADKIPSIIFWGPPGTGKTTLAKIIANQTKSKFYSLSAVLSGVNDLRDVIKKAKMERDLHGINNILFVDEIHRWNKAQQDALLPHVEDGTITLIGATTENPSFEIIGPLLSRCKVYVLNSLSKDDLKEVAKRALQLITISAEADALDFIAESSYGDARRALNTIEICSTLAKSNLISLQNVEEAIQRKSLLYDKGGEEHYNVISAFIKSMRGSSPDAAIYYLARMLEAGEEPLFIARRMVIFASEDIGNADPQAIQVAIACMQSYDFVGMPEGWIPLAHCATYLASAPKSKAAYKSYMSAKKDIDQHGNLEVPMHIRNAPTDLMNKLGYGEGYKDPHSFENNFALDTNYLPEKIKDANYYYPTESGYEKIIKERLNKLWKK
ncbi:replication-associated recombination protein A [bacterium]|nr:replication-associated recombination protein A [bacterium]